ncbi:MAG: hypothetical protein M0Q23_05185 [Syntrophales bacterium]|nr:hypothetical protein [Syntrophales bacterium]
MAIDLPVSWKARAARAGGFLASVALVVVPVFPAVEVALCFDCPALGDATYESGAYCVHEYTTVGGASFQRPHPDIQDVEYLVVGGGGGGAGMAPAGSFGAGGGGGAGGMVEGAMRIDDTIYPITVGFGGAGGSRIGTADGGTGKDGCDSRLGSRVAVGGGGGGTFTTGPTMGNPGRPGGSGGGGGLRSGVPGGASTQTSPAGGRGYGHDGGSSGPSGSAVCGIYDNHAGGGGGGAGTSGSHGGVCRGGSGGDGRLSPVTGTMLAGGGGGAGYSGCGFGGSGGGGDGAMRDGGDGMAGTAGSGGGGGGSSSGNGGDGGSGIVVIRYEKPANRVTVDGPVILNVGGGITIGGQGQASDEDFLTATLGWVSVVDGGTNRLTAVIRSGTLPSGTALSVNGDGFNTVRLTDVPQAIRSGIRNEARTGAKLAYRLEVTDFSSLAPIETARSVTVEFAIEEAEP